MITNLSPALKNHIELYINDIEKNKLSQSIIYCPPIVLHEYIEVLRQIDVTIPPQLDCFIRITEYLASRFNYFEFKQVELLQDGAEQYDFKLPLTNINYEELVRELQSVLPLHTIDVLLTNDFVSGLTLTVYIQPVF